MTSAPGGGAARRNSSDGQAGWQRQRTRGPRRPPPGFRGPVRRSGQRYFMSMAAMTVCLGAILTRLLFVQGISATRYQQDARSEYIHEISYLGERGAILDRNGDELAMSVPMTTVYADPYQIDNPHAEAVALSGALGLPEASVQDDLSEDSGFVYLAHTVPDAVAARVAALMKAGSLPGIYTMQEPKRFYPSGQLASPLLGIVGTDGEGLSGLEYKYNGLLEGKPGKLVEDMDPAGGQIPGGVRQYQAPLRGDDLVLSIDEPLQYDAEEDLARAIVASQAESGMALIMDSRTGELLAAADLTMPTASEPATMHEPSALPLWFVPPGGPPAGAAAIAESQPVEAPSASVFTNVYEPGSVEKLITVSAALASGSITPGEVFKVPGSYDVAGTAIQDAWWHPDLYWTASNILAHSSDIGTVEIAQKMGMPTLLSYIHDFGIGDATDIGFPGESAGLVPGPSQWSGTTIATVPIGQGIAVTAIQMLDAYNVIANDGMFIAPRLADGYVDAEGREHLFPSPKPRRVIGAQISSEMTSMLEGVVRVGTGTAANLEPYTVAGKTGTALVPSPKGGYINGFFVSSFAGFVPAEDPAITAMVVVVGTHQYGAEASAPVFAMLARDALQALGVPPHKPQPGPADVPQATAYGGEGEAAGGPLPGLSGAPDVVSPSAEGSASGTGATATTATPVTTATPATTPTPPTAAVPATTAPATEATLTANASSLPPAVTTTTSTAAPALTSTTVAGAGAGAGAGASTAAASTAAAGSTAGTEPAGN